MTNTRGGEQTEIFKPHPDLIIDFQLATIEGSRGQKRLTATELAIFRRLLDKQTHVRGGYCPIDELEELTYSGRPRAVQSVISHLRAKIHVVHGENCLKCIEFNRALQAYRLTSYEECTIHPPLLLK